METFLSITRALSDANRVRALMALRGGELCLCQIIELLDLAPSTVSKHMSILRQAGLVQNRKEERWNYYRLPDSKTTSNIDRIITLVTELVSSDDSIKKDMISLSKILKTTPEALCKKHKNATL